MSQGCALWMSESKCQRLRSQCSDYWKWFFAHNCFPFTSAIIKLHAQIPCESRICLTDIGVKNLRSLNWLPRGVFVPLGQPHSSFYRSYAFLVYLSRKLKCTIVITRCPSSVVNISHFQLLLCNRWTEFNETWQEARSQRPLPSLCFWADRKNKMAAVASDWLRNFRPLLCNRWTEFNETWQEARSQCPLPSLCFSGRSEKQDGRPGLWLAETFSTSPLKPLNGIQRYLTGSKISTSSTTFVFFGPIGKARWLPWPVICWDIFYFSCETPERNSTKLVRKQDINVLYQVCVFRADRKNNMAALASDWLIHFRLLLWNRWTEFNETWQEERSQRPLPSLRFWADRKNNMAALASDWLRHFLPLLWNPRSEFNETWQEAWSQCPLPGLCFSGRSEKQYGRPALWLAERFPTSSLKLLNGIQRYLTGSKISTSSTKFEFFGPIRKTRWPPWPLIDWGIFDFTPETTEWNSTKLDRKQDLNVLYQICVFRADRKNNMAALPSDWLRDFRLLLWNCWTEFNDTWQEARSQRPLPSLSFLGRSEKQYGRPGLWLAETFSTSPLKPLNGIQRNLTGSMISMFYTKFVFFGPIGKIIWRPGLWLAETFYLLLWNPWGRPGLWLAEKFYLLLWNHWTEFNEIDRKQDLNVLYQVCFLGPIGKTKRPPCPLIGWEIFDFFSETAEWNSTKLGTGSKISTSSIKFTFFGPIGKIIWPSWPLTGWDIFDFSSETPERNSTKLDRKQDLNVLYQICVFRADRKNNMAALASDLLRHFIFSSETPEAALASDWLRHFIFSSKTPERNSMKLDKKQHLNVLYQVCVFWVDRKYNMAALASDWLRHFRLLLWNRWTEFNETW